MAFLFLYWKYIAAAALVAVVAIAYNVHTDNLIRQAVTKAVTERDNEWRKAEQERIAEADARARKIEAEHKLDLEALSTEYQKELADAKTQRDRDVANARSGALVLRIPASFPSAGDGGKVAAPASGSDGAATTELPREITANLLALADDADAVVKQLTACQAVVLSDRKGSP